MPRKGCDGHTWDFVDYESCKNGVSQEQGSNGEEVFPVPKTA